ncbi:DUF695 domain-containing protein [Daejeonella sp. JGW-45]|uniref:DUF695 domain-containing protein n=1 Tax=Daejeonella sp. JGW-45 TaxID=3034148 RepID=UPI0023EC360F|nr:DUF695 domain-containing protein [Daejeonella sp. JGW-45]
MKNICLLMLCALPFTSCSQSNQKETVSPPITQTSLPDTFTTLKFELDGKPCMAVINNKFKDFKGKAEYSLSLFLTVKTIEKDANGHPTEKESVLFHELQARIMKDLGLILPYCHTGTTTMNGYRDILLYISPSDQDKAIAVLNKIKQENPRFESYTFEPDPEWEAVASFYEAIPAKN